MTSALKKKRKLSNKPAAAAAIPAPNNYNHLQSNYIKSHSLGHVSGLSFFPDNPQYLASVGGIDGELIVWDLKTSGGPCRLPTMFMSPDGRQRAAASRRSRRSPIQVCNAGNDTMIWVGSNHSIYGYSVFENGGGPPKQVLNGHLNSVTCLEQYDRKLFSGSNDGMILTWGNYKKNTSRNNEAKTSNATRATATATAATNAATSSFTRRRRIRHFHCR